MENETWSVFGAMAALGAVAQTWRASVGLANWWMYPILFGCAVLAQVLWGSDTQPLPFARHVVESWLLALGTNRIVSDAAKGTSLETRRTVPAPLKED